MKIREWLRTEDAGRFDTPTGGRFSILIAGVWLVFLLEPIRQAWAIGGARGDVGLAITLAFCLTYLWFFAHTRRFAWGGERLPQERTGRLLRYLLLWLIASLGTTLIGQPGAGMFVFVAVAGLFCFRVRWAYLIAAIIAVSYQVASQTAPGWRNDPGTTFAVFLAVVAVSGGILAARRGRELNDAQRINAQLAVQEERNRVARDVHDILGHTLTVIRVKAELAGALVEIDPARAKAEIIAVEELAREALADTRRAVEGFREISLPGELVRAKSALSAAAIEAAVPGTVDEVPADLRELFAWAVREGTTNVVKHSAATNCRITITPTAVTIADNGRAGDGAGKGNGLTGLRERAQAAGAVLVTRVLEPGFELSVRVATRGAVDDQSDERGSAATESRSVVVDSGRSKERSK